MSLFSPTLHFQVRHHSGACRMLSRHRQRQTDSVKEERRQDKRPIESNSSPHISSRLSSSSITLSLTSFYVWSLTSQVHASFFSVLRYSLFFLYVSVCPEALQRRHKKEVKCLWKIEGKALDIVIIKSSSGKGPRVKGSWDKNLKSNLLFFIFYGRGEIWVGKRKVVM